MNEKLFKVLNNPALLFLTLGQRGCFNWIPDETYLKIAYRIKTGKRLHLNPPITFNEKLQWLKLHDRRPEYTMMVDKYEVKKYVAEIIGEEHIIPTYGVWERFDDINFDLLPNQFVLKCTHDSGGLIICKDKALFNREKARKKINSCLRHNFYWGQREWPYKNVKPRIIAEKYMTNDGGEIEDYKVHNFNGTPKVILLCRDRYKETGLTEDFFDLKWERLDVSRPDNHKALEVEPRPKELDEMLKLSEQLSRDIPFVRSDFYTIGHKVYFGELTFFPASGLKRFVPDEWDKIFGDWIKLPVGGGNFFLLIKDNKRLLVKIMETKGKSDELSDYKFFCFNGKVEMFKIDFNRFVDHRANYYNRKGELLPFGEVVCPPEKEADVNIPQQLPEMIMLAEKLAKEMAFVRVDFYQCGKFIYFGELTFFPASGFGKFTSFAWDEKLGSKLVLPQ